MEMSTTFLSTTEEEVDHGLNHHYPKPPSFSLPNLILPYLYSNFSSSLSKDLLSQEISNPIFEYVTPNITEIGRALASNSTEKGSDETGGYVESKAMEEIVSVVVPIIFGLIVIVGLFGQ